MKRESYADGDWSAVERLSERSQMIAKLWADEGATYSALGELFGVSKERIRRLVAGAIRRAERPERTKRYHRSLPPLPPLTWDTPLSDFVQRYDVEVSVRVGNCLRWHGKGYTLRDVRNGKQVSHIKRIPNFGKVSLAELEFLVAGLQQAGEIAE